MQNFIRTILIVVSLLALHLPAATPVEIWITPTGSGGGTGTATDPFSAPTADSFFDLIHDKRVVGGSTYVIPENSVIHLMPGTFLTHEGTTASGGFRFGLTAKNGWKVRGAGMDVTIVKLIDNHPANPNKVQVIGGGGSGYHSWETPGDGIEISDLTVDCNLQNQSQQHCPTAVALGGSDNKIMRVHAINWGSTKPSGTECFPIAVGSHYQIRSQGYRNGLIEDCIVDQPAPGISHTEGTTCISVGNWGNTSLDQNGPLLDLNLGNWTIRGCTVRNITTGSGTGQPAYVHAFGGGGRGVDVHHNFAVNLLGPGAVGSYADTWQSEDVIYRDNTYLNVNVGVLYSVGCHTWGCWYQTNLAFINNVITFTNGGSGVGLDNIYGDSIGVMEGIRIVGNTISPHVPGASGTALGIHGNIEFIADNNVLDGGPAGSDFFVSGGNVNYIRPLSFRNNRNLRGQPLVISDWTGSVVGTLKGYEEELTFTPTTTGWHRLVIGACCTWSGRMQISSPWGTDLSLAYHVSEYDAGLGDISQLYNNSWNGYGGISSVRVAKYATPGTTENAKWANQTYFGIDANIGAELVNQKVTIKLSGNHGPVVNMRPLAPYTGQFAPYPAEVSPTASVDLNLGPGVRTSGPLVSGSGGGIPLTDSSGHVLSSSLNIVQPAQGGLGANNSTLPADRFPYTTSTGVFGYGTVTTFARTLLDDADAAAVRATLGLPTKVSTTADQSFGTSVADVTGLSFPVAANTDYGFEFKIIVVTTNATEGYQLAVNGPGTPTDLAAGFELPRTSTILNTHYGINSYGTLVAATSGPGSARFVATISGTLRNGGTAGTFTVRARSASAANGLVIKKASWGQYWNLP